VTTRPNVLTFLPEPIDDYAVAHTTPLPPPLRELEAVTRARFPEQAHMLCGQMEGTFLQLLLGAMGARRVLDIGTFTGMSALMMAAALPDDGRVVTCDLDPRALAVAREYVTSSPHGHKIEVREGPALETMRALEPGFDLVFVDADKENYTNYYEAALPLLAPNGVIAVDNVLWSGRVLDPQTERDRGVVAFNEHVQADARVTNVILTIRDGIMLIRRTDQPIQRKGAEGAEAAKD